VCVAVRQGKRFVVVVAVGGAAAAGVTFVASGIDATIPTMGATLGIGTAAAELTPRLPISVDPNGIPGRAAPPGAIGEVDVGVEDDAMLLEPAPHIPDIPAVSSSPDVVDIPDGMEIPASLDIAVPTAIPPPSKLVADPDVDDGAVPRVEQIVPLLGIEMVPVMPDGVGLTPGDAISVAPNGMPVGPTAEFVVMPSGDVPSIMGVGIAIPLT